MASVRDNILGALVARLATIATPGPTATLIPWHVARQKARASGDFAVKASVFLVSESKRPRTNETYGCTMLVGVLITGRAEDVSPTLDLDEAGQPNVFRYLDRLVVAAEKKIHDPDDGWGITPSFDHVSIDGHDVDDPTEDNEVQAMLRLAIVYRHELKNPEA